MVLRSRIDIESKQGFKYLILFGRIQLLTKKAARKVWF